MIGKSIWSYIFIRTCIFFLHWIAPVSVLYCFVSFLTPFEVFPAPKILQLWAFAEAIFYLLVYLPYKRHLQSVAIHPPLVSRESRHELFQRCHNNLLGDPERYLSKWFMNASRSEIKRDNVKEFFRWAFLNSGEPDPADDEELDVYVQAMENLLGRELEPGRGSAKCIRLSLDKVDVLHRSLTWYLCVSVVDAIATGWLFYNSFDLYRNDYFHSLSVFPFRPLSFLSSQVSSAKTITYWHRRHTSKTRLPILFIHGIGIGLYPYVNLLSELNTAADPDGELGIIAIEIMPVSFRLGGVALRKQEMCQEIWTILQTHGWKKFVLVSHSYGSVVAAHLIHAPQIAMSIGPILFIDPICFLLHLPDVAYNFTYRKPVHANEHQLYYFASKDMGVAHTLSRRFFWSENILWKEDLQGRQATVILGGKDLIVDTEAVGAYLTGLDHISRKSRGWKEATWKGQGLDVVWFPELDHAQVFDKKTTRGAVINIIRAYCNHR